MESRTEVTLEDVLRAAGILTLGQQPPEEAVRSTLVELERLARGENRLRLQALLRPAVVALGPHGVPESRVREALGLSQGAAVGQLLSDVAPQEVRWLWPSRIPLGRLTILDGDPGLGKSSVTLDLTARVTTGSAMPDGLSGLDRPRGVVLMGIEDGLADTVRPRLDAAGADVGRVFALQAVERSGGGRSQLPVVTDVDAIWDAAERVDAALLIIDPLSAFLGTGVDAHRDTDVRQALADLGQLAAETGLAVLAVRHLNKSGGRSPIYRGGGSIAIIAAARSGLLLALDTDDPKRRVLATTKCNLAEHPPSLALELVTDSGAVRARWLGESSRTASDLLGEDRSGSALDDAVAFLRSELSEGEVPTLDMKARASEAGISWRTVERAKSIAGVTAKRCGFGRGAPWVWTLAPKAANPDGGLRPPRAVAENAENEDAADPRAIPDCGMRSDTHRTPTPRNGGLWEESPHPAISFDRHHDGGVLL